MRLLKAAALYADAVEIGAVNLDALELIHRSPLVDELDAPPPFNVGRKAVVYRLLYSTRPPWDVGDEADALSVNAWLVRVAEGGHRTHPALLQPTATR